MDFQVDGVQKQKLRGLPPEFLRKEEENELLLN